VQTQGNILKTLLALRDDGMTILSVSKHVTAARDADKILVLQKGVIVEHGTYDELHAAGSVFYSLCGT